MVCYVTTKGNFRKTNQDYVGFKEDGLKRIYVMADGMGGYNAGEIASKTAVEAILQYIDEQNEFADLEKIITNAILFGNEKILKLSEENSEYSGMGTTITACLIYGDEIAVANAGDSRCYIITEDKISKITKDHSLVQELLDDGSISEEEAKNYPNKNIITRALGVKSDIDIDTYVIDKSIVKKGILTTDGLTNFLSEEDMFKIICENDNETACERLVDLSLKNGSRDNVSILIFEGDVKDDRY